MPVHDGLTEYLRLNISAEVHRFAFAEGKLNR